MAIHLYLDEQLTQQISEGDFSNPDADNYNGTDGEIKDRQIYVANEQTYLAVPIEDIDGVQTEIELTEPRFADGGIHCYRHRTDEDSLRRRYHITDSGQSCGQYICSLT